MSEAAPAARPIVLAIEPDAVFGTFHDAASPGDTAVLICPPFGWDEITSYRSRRAWAERLAADGHPTLRIDLPGAGDSEGLPGDGDRLLAWSNAIGGSAAWLANRPGVSRVVAIGLGLGGLVAAVAIADGAPIAEMVLWAAPESGRSWLREQRAFASLQTTRADTGGDPVSSERSTDDGLEVGGFSLAPETIAALQPLALGDLLAGRLGRALLLDRDGLAYSPRIGDALSKGGAEVSQASGAGWTQMVFHPEEYRAPVEVFDTVGAWLAQPSANGRLATTVEPPTEADAMEIREDGVAIRERPVRIAEPFGELFGIGAEPVEPAGTDLVAVFLNAGAVRRVGPNRLWVETARRWAARGVPSVRMDLEGIGDADGDPRRYRDVGNFYTPEFGAQVTSIINDLESRGLGPRFVLIGLCAGAYWAFHRAASDDRIVEAIILNPRAMIWDSGLLARREAQKVGQLLEAGSWSRIVRGEVGVSRMVAVSRAAAGSAAGAARRAPGRLVDRLRSTTQEDPVESRLDILRDRGTRLVLAFSGGEPVYDELEADGVIGHLDRWPNVELVQLPASDHTLRPLEAQAAASDLLDRELDRLLGSGGA